MYDTYVIQRFFFVQNEIIITVTKRFFESDQLTTTYSPSK